MIRSEFVGAEIFREFTIREEKMLTTDQTPTLPALLRLMIVP